MTEHNFSVLLTNIKSAASDAAPTPLAPRLLSSEDPSALLLMILICQNHI